MWLTPASCPRALPRAGALRRSSERSVRLPHPMTSPAPHAAAAWSSGSQCFVQLRSSSRSVGCPFSAAVRAAPRVLAGRRPCPTDRER